MARVESSDKAEHGFSFNNRNTSFFGMSKIPGSLFFDMYTYIYRVFKIKLIKELIRYIHLSGKIKNIGFFRIDVSTKQNEVQHTVFRIHNRIEHEKCLWNDDIDTNS